MPTVLILGPYRFFFYSADEDEPLHIHVERDRNKAKFWLDPVRLADSKGFSQSEIKRIEKLVVENKSLFVGKWNEYFG